MILSNKTIPNAYLCPITHELMVDPVCTETGHTYERSAIQSWLEEHDTEPMTNTPLKTKILFPNLFLKQTIQAWLSENTQHIDQDLLEACKAGDKEAVARCLKLGANLETTDELGRTPLLVAAHSADKEVITYLLTQGANPKARSLDEATLLHWAAYNPHSDVIGLLLQQECKLEARDKQGHTPLHRAVLQYNEQAACALLEQGANYKAKNLEGKTPLQVAENHPIAQALIDKVQEIKQQRVHQLQQLAKRQSQFEQIVKLQEVMSSHSSFFKRALIEVKPTQKQVLQTQGVTNTTHCYLQALPNGGLVSSYYNATKRHIALWDSQTGECLTNWEAPHKTLAVLSNGQIAIGSDDNMIKLWDTQTQECVKILEAKEGITGLTVLPNGLLASCSNSTIKIWNTETDQCLKTWQGTQYFPKNHTRPNYHNYGGYNQHLQRYNHFTHLAALPNGQLVSCSSQRDSHSTYNFSMIEIWSVQTGTCLKTIECEHNVRGLTVTLDGFIACSYQKKQGHEKSGGIQVWDAKTGECLHNWPGKASYYDTVISNHNQLIAGFSNGIIKIYDVQTGHCVKTWQAHDGEITSLALLPNGRLASSSSDETIKIWDIAEVDEVLEKIEQHEPQCRMM